MSGENEKTRCAGCTRCRYDRLPRREAVALSRHDGKNLPGGGAALPRTGVAGTRVDRFF